MNFLLERSPVLLAFAATLFTWLITVLGASVVFFFKKINKNVLNTMLGFSSGIMIAASFWSLLAPAVEMAEKSSLPAYAVASAGFLFGAFFTLASDLAISKFEGNKSFSKKHKRLSLLIGAITIHNIPEGLAVGVAFGALAGEGMTPLALMSAISVAVGIGLQNFPEGAAVSIPMRAEGFSRGRSFFFGQMSGMVEPIAGVLGALLVTYVKPILPYALSFAAGAMIYVVVQELIPETVRNKECEKHVSEYLASVGCIFGFLLMMLLDVALS